MDLIKMQIMKYLQIVSKSFDNSFDLLTTWYYIRALLSEANFPEMNNFCFFHRYYVSE